MALQQLAKAARATTARSPSCCCRAWTNHLGQCLVYGTGSGRRYRAQVDPVDRAVCRSGSPSAWPRRASAWWRAKRASAACSSLPTGGGQSAGRPPGNPETGLLHPPQPGAGELSFEQIERRCSTWRATTSSKLSEAVLAGQAARVQRMLDGLQAEGEAEVLVHYIYVGRRHSCPQAGQGCHGPGPTIPMALRENRIWGVRSGYLRRVLPQA